MEYGLYEKAAAQFLRFTVQLKMSEKSLFAVLLRSPWWVSFAVAIAVGIAGYMLLPDRFKVIGALSGMPFVVIGSMAFWRQMRAPNPARIEATLQALAALSSRDFLNALEAGYQQDGYVVARVTISGADLSISKAGRTSLVSCKRWKAATHGVEPLRELNAAVTQLDANQGIYVAVNALSDAATTYASKNSIRLLPGNTLAMLTRHHVAPAKPRA